jgi:hypothetical protein
VPRRFAWLGLALAVLTALVLAWTALAQLESLAEREADARAQLLADGIAHRVQRAVALGIPLDRLEGVQALFAQRIGESREIASLALTDTAQRVLWRYPPQDGAVNASAARTVSPVLLQGKPVAQIELTRRPHGSVSLLLQWAPLLLCAALATALAAAEAARYAAASGPRLREDLLRSVCGSVAAGDFSRRLPVMRRRSFDGRLPWLAAELRQTNEQHVRLSRLVHSLRQTEPNATRRAELDAALVTAAGQETFAAGAARETLPLPHAAGARWLGVLAGWLAWSVASAVAVLTIEATGQGPGTMAWGAWGVGTALAAGAMLQMLARLPWQVRLLARERSAWIRGGLIGVLLVGPGWAVVLGALVPGLLQRQQALVPALAAALALGCLLVLLLSRAPAVPTAPVPDHDTVR